MQHITDQEAADNYRNIVRQLLQQNNITDPNKVWLFDPGDKGGMANAVERIGQDIYVPDMIIIAPVAEIAASAKEALKPLSINLPETVELTQWLRSMTGSAEYRIPRKLKKSISTKRRYNYQDRRRTLWLDLTLLKSVNRKHKNLCLASHL